MGQALRKNKTKYKKSEVVEVVNLMKYIFCNEDECFIRILEKQTGINKAYPISVLKDPNKLFQVVKKFGKKDVFLNLNPFRTMNKATRNNLFCINNIAVDVDYKKIKEFKNLQPEQIIKLLELDFFDVKIPTPNVVEFGNQVRLIYKLNETVYVPKYRDNVLILARRISEVFAKELESYGAEKQNPETYFRFPNSTNTKNGATIKFLKYTDSVEYTLKELQQLWLEELPKWYKRRKGRNKSPAKVVKLHNVYAFNSNRLKDLELIQEYLNRENIKDLRARLCFLFRNYILIKNKYQNGELKPEDFKYAKEEMLKFNSKFKYPLRDNVIESATRVVNYRQYLYKNDTLVNFLEIDYQLCEMLGLQSMYKVLSREERNKRNYIKNKEKIIKKVKKNYKEKLKSQGKITKKQQIKILREKIKNLRDEGLKNKEIMRIVGITSTSTFERHISYLKKNGLI